MSIKCPDSGIKVGSVLPKGKNDLSPASDEHFICALATMLRAPFLSSLLVVSDTQLLPLGCICIVRLSRFVWAITSTFMHGFQNNLAQLFF